jgi:hypothetical protein
MCVASTNKWKQKTRLSIGQEGLVAGEVRQRPVVAKSPYGTPNCIKTSKMAKINFEWAEKGTANSMQKQMSMAMKKKNQSLSEAEIFRHGYTFQKNRSLPLYILSTSSMCVS